LVLVLLRPVLRLSGVAPSPEVPRRDGIGANRRRRGTQKKIEAECNSQKSKEVAALTQQRVAAFNAYENCLVEYKQTWSSDPTPKQYCAPKLAQHVQIAQEVRDRQAKNCTAAVPPMKK
jgi:hypothetical protein